MEKMRPERSGFEVRERAEGTSRERSDRSGEEGAEVIEEGVVGVAGGVEEGVVGVAEVVEEGVAGVVGGVGVVGVAGVVGVVGVAAGPGAEVTAEGATGVDEDIWV